VPGASVGLVDQGEVTWLRGFGVADLGSKTPMTDSTVFNVGSVSKAISAWGVMRLVEQGRLSLDAPVVEYLTRWRLPSSGFDARGVTLRRLLSHTSGISQPSVHTFTPHDPLPSLEAELQSAVRLLTQPGTEFRYSGGGYILAQLIIEEQAGLGFEAFLQREILRPLGMHHSTFDWPPATRLSTATPYSVRGYQVEQAVFAAKAAAALLTTARDLARWVAAGLAGPEGSPVGRGVLRPETVAEMYAPQPATRRDSTSNRAWGLGYAIRIFDDGTRLVSHGGSNVGWEAWFGAFPKERVGMVILTNSENGEGLIHDVVCRWYQAMGQRC